MRGKTMEMDQVIKMNTWRVEKIAVVGAGIVGVPMAALLAQARIRQGHDVQARVCVIQRNSATSGWKVEAINSGRSPIGGIEPELSKIISTAVSKKLLSASHDYSELKDADIILVCVQTDKDEFRPDYRPLFVAVENIAGQLQRKKEEKIPLIIFESTLAPSSMASVIKMKFAEHGLHDGRDIILANSPNRVMPGRLVERIRNSDKIIGGLTPLGPRLVRRIYSQIVTQGTLHLTNSLTAEIVKTLENAYRDVRIAYSTEIARYCDANDWDFYYVRGMVNDRLSWEDKASIDPNAVPTGGLLIPTIGVGGHCLPKDGILLLWRLIESKKDLSGSMILEARKINDESPSEVVRSLEKHFGNLAGKSIALMGTAYRFNSEDTRNSPTLYLAVELLKKGVRVKLHDPYVKSDDQNLIKSDLQKYFPQDIISAVRGAEVLVFCAAHQIYKDDFEDIIKASTHLEGIFDGCNLFQHSYFARKSLSYQGIGKGKMKAPRDFLVFVVAGFRAIERGFANEIQKAVDFFNDNFCDDDFNRVNFDEVRCLAATCITRCDLAEPGPVTEISAYRGFFPRLVRTARNGSL